MFDFDSRIGWFGIGAAHPFVGTGMCLVFAVLRGWPYRVGGLPVPLDRMGGVSRALAYVAVILSLSVSWPTAKTAFIYFQF